MAKAPTINVDLHAPEIDGGLTESSAKEFLGWTEESNGENWGKNYTLRDLDGHRIRLTKCITNRPFKAALAKRYALDMLRKKWALNGETIVIDRKHHVQSGQHRLVGLVLAEQMRRQDPGRWNRWKGEVEIPALIVTGISEKPEVVDTLDIGDSRRLRDVLFRRREYADQDLSPKDQQKLANILAVAIRLVWLRTGGKQVSDAPHFPHSEALDFLQEHPQIKDCVMFIYNEEGGGGAEGRLISSRVSLGYAAGFMYLMGTAKTDPDGGDIDHSLQKKSETFWVQFASGADLAKNSPILTLRNQLDKIDASGVKGREQVCGMLVKAWNAFIDGKTLTPRQIRVKERVNKETGKHELAECPRIGGLDVEHEPEPDPISPPKKTPAAAAKWKIGDTAWVRDDEEGHWFGTIVDIGKTEATVTAKQDGADYTVPLDTLTPNNPDHED